MDFHGERDHVAANLIRGSDGKRGVFVRQPEAIKGEHSNVAISTAHVRI